MTNVFALAVDRSYGRCEALVAVHETYARCGKAPVEVHHRLTRARGGDVLDQAGELYHLMCLCNEHHRWAHSNSRLSYLSGMMLQGQVWLEGDTVVYNGPDRYLMKKYGREHAVEVRQSG